MPTITTEIQPDQSGISEESQRISRHNPALDGVRGIAVLSVMLFHFGLSWLPGGYLGVDIFFVLSGYLITTLLLREHNERGSISFGRFWARRARRLFPALGTMLLAVALVAAFSVPLTMKTVFQQGLATLVYSNNWFLILHRTSYFDQFQDPSPLLHTWSLGIEEQWYVVFPVALLGVLWFLRKKPDLLAVVLGGAALTSAAWGTYLTLSGASIDRIYFGTDVRCQELLVGGALAALVSSKGKAQLDRFASRKFVRNAGWGGLAVIALLLLTTHGDARWQYSVGLMVLSLAVASVIWASTRPGSTIGQTLSWKPLTYIGLISYGLYLWHWPLFVWLRSDKQSMGTPQILSVLTLTVAIASASFYLLEMPVRRMRWQWTFGKRGWSAAIVAPLVIAAVLSACTQDRRSVVGDTTQRAVYAAGGYSGTGPKVFLLGDSLGNNLRASFGKLPDPGFALTGTTYLGCGVYPNALYVEGEQRPNDFPCQQWYEQWAVDLVNTRPDLTVVMLPIQFRHDIADDQGRVLTFGTPEYRAYVEELLERSRVRALAGSRAVAFVDGTCNRVPGGNTVADQLNDDSRQKWINGVLTDYINQHPGVFDINLSSWDCGTTPADATRNAAARKYDGLHYNPEGSVAAWQVIEPQILRILKKIPPRSSSAAPSTNDLP